MSSLSTSGYAGIPVPVGSIMYMATTSQVPQSYLICDGGFYDREIYDELFSVIGTSFGSSTATDFALPDLISYGYIQGATISNPTPVASTATISPFFLGLPAIPSLSAGNFAFGSLDTTAFIQTGGTQNQWQGANVNNINAVPLTATDCVKASSSDYSDWNGSASGNISYTNGSQQSIQPTTSSSTATLAGFEMIPVVKAWSGFTSPTYVPLSPASITDSYFPPAPQSQYVTDPQLSGFVVTKPVY